MTRDLCRFSGVRITLRNDDANDVKSRAIQGVAMAAGIATVAWRLRALSTSGAVAATLIGGAVHVGMGARGSVAVVSYFASASALGRLPRPGAVTQQRGNRRDAVQVLANGGPPAVFSLVHARSGTLGRDRAAAAFYGSLAAAAADTWATEVGTRIGGTPRSLATGRIAAIGDSGAVTPAGLAASALAALAIALAAQPEGHGQSGRVVRCLAGGMAGSLADSLLGALMQEQRWCSRCEVGTELVVHTCGNPTHVCSGIRGANNDVVNLTGVTVGGIAAAALAAILPHLTGRNGSRVEFATTVTNSRLSGTPGAP